MSEMIKNKLDTKQFSSATDLWGEMEGMISRYSFGADFYNVINHRYSGLSQKYSNLKIPQMAIRALQETESLDDLMNNEIKNYLNM